MLLYFDALLLSETCRKLCSFDRRQDSLMIARPYSISPIRRFKIATHSKYYHSNNLRYTQIFANVARSW